MFKESLKKLARVKGVRLGYDREKSEMNRGIPWETLNPCDLITEMTRPNS